MAAAVLLTRAFCTTLLIGLINSVEIGHSSEFTIISELDGESGICFKSDKDGLKIFWTSFERYLGNVGHWLAFDGKIIGELEPDAFDFLKEFWKDHENRLALDRVPKELLDEVPEDHLPNPKFDWFHL